MVGAEAYLGESITEKGVEGALDLGDVEALGDLADDIANFSDQRALVDGCTFVSRVFTRSVGPGSLLTAEGRAGEGGGEEGDDRETHLGCCLGRLKVLEGIKRV